MTPSIGLDATVASTPHAHAPHAHAPHAHAPRALATTLGRTTVLPRLEMHGAQPKLVVDGRPRYVETRRLGEGGIGEVLGARDNDIGRDVAVKRLLPGVSSPANLARFVDEVRTIGKLEHPNIVPIHDVGVDERGEYYFVMKYVDGETLETIIDKLAAGDPLYHARFGVERRVQIFTALLEAVAFAHEKGIVHRDIKPANVMVGAYGEVVLMDWGIAQHTGEASPLDVAGHLVGTPAYMSPEQARGEAVDVRSDIYSLSLLFHELLCLRHPLADKDTIEALLHGVVHEPIPAASFVSNPHQASVPMELSWFVRKGLAKHPANRYQSVQEMIDRLARRAEGNIPIQCHVTLVKRMNNEWTRFLDRHPILTTIGLALSALGIIGGAIAAVAVRF